MTREEAAAVTTGTPGAEESPRPAVAESGAGAGLDKVRDILFGVQVREIERRFARLEERLLKETGEIREDVQRRLDALESYARRESEVLAEQIRKEQTARVEAGRDLRGEIAETARAAEQRAAALDEQLAKSQRESRQQLLEQYQRLSEEIRAKVDEVLATLAREAQELRADKVDRAALASFLNEMAIRLTDDLTMRSVEELGNA